jgi:hypothetical protein
MITSGCGDGAGAAAEPAAVVDDGRAFVEKSGVEERPAGAFVISASVFTAGISGWRSGGHCTAGTPGKAVRNRTGTGPTVGK